MLPHLPNTKLVQIVLDNRFRISYNRRARKGEVKMKKFHVYVEGRYEIEAEDKLSAEEKVSKMMLPETELDDVEVEAYEAEVSEKKEK